MEKFICVQSYINDLHLLLHHQRRTIDGVRSVAGEIITGQIKLSLDRH